MFSCLTPFSCLGILYMYIHFRPMMITENDRNYLKKIKDLIYRFSLGGKFYETVQAESCFCKSNRKSMNRNWSNQKANPALKTKTGNK